MLTMTIFVCEAQEDEIIDSIQVESQESSDIFFREQKFDPFTDESNPPDIRMVPDSVVKKMQLDDAFWYASESFHKEVEEPVKNRSYKEPVTAKKWFRTLMWIIIIAAFVAAVIWYLSASNFRFFGRKAEKVSLEDEDVETEDIFGINYEREIAKAEQANNFRLATRLRFLQLLKTFSEKNIIRYQQDRTNFDYLTQLASSQYYSGFFRLVRNYEYAWYGKMDPGAEGYAKIRSDFSQINSLLA